MSGYVGYVKQSGITVAKVFAPTLARAAAETAYYAWQYADEGPVETSVRKCPERKAKRSDRHCLTLSR